MSSVVITRTTALYPSAVFLQWVVSSDETGVFLVDVARAGGPSGPWDTIVVGLQNAYNFVDDNFNLPGPPVTSPSGGEPLNLFSLSRDVYYQVTVTPPSGSANAFSSPPTPIEPGLDVRTRLLKRKLLRDLAVGFRRLNGIPLAVLKRRRWGERCTSCFDPVLGESTREHCKACFGTSFLGGYWAPVLIRGRREAAATQTNLVAHGEEDVKYADFLTLDYPHLEYKDVIVDLNRNERYEVLRMTPTELKTVIVHQKLACSLLSHGSVEYEVPVDPSTTPSLY